MPKEVMEQVRALMREGYPESRAYAIAVANYKRKHGHPPRMHHKVAKSLAGVPPVSEATQTDNRNRQFVITPEILLQQQLDELRRIRQLLEQIAKKP